MRGPVILPALLICASLAAAQSSECAAIRKNGNEITLSAHSWDPVRVLARTLADRFGISLSVEAPKWAFPMDAEDVAIADPEFSATHNNVHYQVMRFHTMNVTFPVGADGQPDDVPGLFQKIRDAANEEMPYAYRLDISGKDYALVPTKTLDSAGKPEDVQPLLVRHVTIPAGTRSIALHAHMMADDLSKQTGLHVACCQSVVAGIPWGMAKLTFEAQDKPAREVLRALIHAEDEANSAAPSRHGAYEHYSVGCDGTGAPWCFIEVKLRFSGSCGIMRY